MRMRTLLLGSIALSAIALPAMADNLSRSDVITLQVGAVNQQLAGGVAVALSQADKAVADALSANLVNTSDVTVDINGLVDGQGAGALNRSIAGIGTVQIGLVDTQAAVAGALAASRDGVANATASAVNTVNASSISAVVKGVAKN